MVDLQAKRRKRRMTTILTLSGAFLLSFLLYVFLYSPKLRELKRMKEEIALRQDAIAREVNRQQVAIAVSADLLEVWKGRVEELNRRLPDREDFERLLYDIGKMARSMGLKDFRLKVEPSEEDGEKARSASGKEISVAKRKKIEKEKKKPGSSLPVSSAVLMIDFTSEYKQMAHFLEAMTKNVRAMSLDEIKLGRSGDRMVAKIKVNAYYREKNEAEAR